VQPERAASNENCEDGANRDVNGALVSHPQPSEKCKKQPGIDQKLNQPESLVLPGDCKRINLESVHVRSGHCFLRRFFTSFGCVWSCV